MLNPYASPQADLELRFEPAEGTRLFALNGRIGRQRYVACCLLGIALAFLYALVAGWLAYFIERKGGPALSGGALQVLGAPFVLIPIVAVLVATRRRLHDFDVGGWWTLMLLFPILQFIFVIYLLVSPGTPQANDFGPVPSATPLGIRLGVVIGCLLVAAFTTLRFL